MPFFDLTIRWVESSEFGPKSDHVGHRILTSDFIPSDYAKSDCRSRPTLFVDRKIKIRSSESDRVRIRPIRTHFFFSIRFGFFSQSWTFYARKKPRRRPREWVHLLSERHPTQKSACPLAQFELLPTSQNLILKIWSSSKSKNSPIFERGTAPYYFSSDYAPWAKTRTMRLGERIFELGTSRRDWLL